MLLVCHVCHRLSKASDKLKTPCRDILYIYITLCLSVCHGINKAVFFISGYFVKLKKYNLIFMNPDKLTN